MSVAEKDIREHKQSLLRPILPPLIWLVHFVLSYVTGAIWCEKFAEPLGSLEGARRAIFGYTALALFGIALTGWRGWQRHVFDGSFTSHDFDSPEDRHRFLGFSTVLLAGLSAMATIFTALAAYFFQDCR
jgi:hypothetical protein